VRLRPSSVDVDLAPLARRLCAGTGGKHAGDVEPDVEADRGQGGEDAGRANVRGAGVRRRAVRLARRWRFPRIRARFGAGGP
jgi:hypothetical protein